MFTLILLLIVTLSTYSATINAISCSYVDVQKAYNSTSNGDTLIIPFGTANWNSCLVVTHGLTISGEGVNKTTINNSQTGNKQWNYILIYDPDSNTVSTNSKFELKNIRFTTNGKDNNAVIQVSVAEVRPLYTNIRIHHCTFDGGSYYNKYMYKAIEFRGGACGLVDNNIFLNVKKVLNSYGTNGTTWNAFYPAPKGSSENLYVESNIIENTINDGSTCCSGVISSGQGGRIVVRYNRWNGIYGYSVLDAHGNQANGVVGSLLFEAYGNRFDFNGESNKMMDLRGGVGIIFQNCGTPEGYYSQSFTIRDEHDDALPPNLKGIEHVHASYIWKNNCKSKEIIPRKDIDINNVMRENIDWWSYTEKFNGTSGIGSGSLSDRPVTCTKGVGYWATEQQDNMPEEYYGNNPKEPIKGTLYVCVKTNVWEPYYKPYTYPHPLSYEQCSIDSVITGDTVKIFGKNFLSIRGDSGFVKINNSPIPAISWTDNLIVVRYTGNIDNVTVRNAGKMVDEFVLSNRIKNQTTSFTTAGVLHFLSAGVLTNQ